VMKVWLRVSATSSYLMFKVSSVEATMRNATHYISRIYAPDLD